MVEDGHADTNAKTAASRDSPAVMTGGTQGDTSANETHNIADNHEGYCRKILRTIFQIMPVDRWVELMLAFAIAGAAISQCSVSNRQWEAMTETNKIATRPSIRVTLQPSAFHIPASGEGAFRGIKFQIENVGKSPTVTQIATGADWQGCGRFIKGVADMNHIATVFVFPDQKALEYSSTGTPITQEHLALADCRSWRPEIWIVIDVLYGRSKEYETRVCTRYLLKEESDGWRLGATDTYPDEACNYAK
jgi:hypothetical protein